MYQMQNGQAPDQQPHATRPKENPLHHVSATMPILCYRTTRKNGWGVHLHSLKPHMRIEKLCKFSVSQITPLPLDVSFSTLRICLGSPSEVSPSNTEEACKLQCSKLEAFARKSNYTRGGWRRTLTGVLWTPVKPRIGPLCCNLQS